jgi:DNA-binding response OmpR family regulator
MGTVAKILVAEHDLAVLQTLALHLQNEEYEVICATEGEEALELARRESPSMMLVDLGLTAGGVSVHDHLAEFPDVVAIPTLYLVSRRAPDSTARKRQTTLPSTVIVEKPVVVSELLAKVASMLAQRDQEPKPATHPQRVA